MKYSIDYLEDMNNNYGNYFVINNKSKEVINSFEKARYEILGLDPYDSKNNYVYITTSIARMLRLETVDIIYDNGAAVYKSRYFCNGLWHFNLHINSNLNCYILVLVYDFSCRPPYIPNINPLPPLNIPSILDNPTLSAPDNTLYISPVEDVEYIYVETKKKKRSSKHFEDIDDDDSIDSSSEEKKTSKKKTSKKKTSKKKTSKKKTSKKKTSKKKTSKQKTSKKKTSKKKTSKKKASKKKTSQKKTSQKKTSQKKASKKKTNQKKASKKK